MNEKTNQEDRAEQNASNRGPQGACCCCGGLAVRVRRGTPGVVICVQTEDPRHAEAGRPGTACCEPQAEDTECCPEAE
jgi:hypothetical protein